MKKTIKTQRKTGIELIAKERESQQIKHKRTIADDVQYNCNGELIWAAGLLATVPDQEIEASKEMLIHTVLKSWNGPILDKMVSKPYKERLIVAGALIAAELDRLNAIEP